MNLATLLNTVAKGSSDLGSPLAMRSRIDESYAAIASALLQLEERFGVHTLLLRMLKSHFVSGKSQLLFTEDLYFRRAVAVVPLEVLAAYLEDLLDLASKPRDLMIHKSGVSLVDLVVLSSFVFLILGVLINSFVFGLAVSGFSFLTLIMSIPFYFCWFLVFKHSILRRVAFAKIISREIKRRSGSGQVRPFWQPTSKLGWEGRVSLGSIG